MVIINIIKFDNLNNVSRIEIKYYFVLIGSYLKGTFEPHKTDPQLNTLDEKVERE